MILLLSVEKSSKKLDEWVKKIFFLVEKKKWIDIPRKNIERILRKKKKKKLNEPCF